VGFVKKFLKKLAGLKKFPYLCSTAFPQIIFKKNQFLFGSLEKKLYLCSTDLS
jgi:hypothetical protein